MLSINLLYNFSYLSHCYVYIYRGFWEQETLAIMWCCACVVCNVNCTHLIVQFPHQIKKSLRDFYRPIEIPGYPSDWLFEGTNLMMLISSVFLSTPCWRNVNVPIHNKCCCFYCPFLSKVLTEFIMLFRPKYSFHFYFVSSPFPILFFFFLAFVFF